MRSISITSTLTRWLTKSCFSWSRRLVLWVEESIRPKGRVLKRWNSRFRKDRRLKIVKFPRNSRVQFVTVRTRTDSSRAKSVADINFTSSVWKDGSRKKKCVLFANNKYFLIIKHKSRKIINKYSTSELTKSIDKRMPYIIWYLNSFLF